jgi:hypothetical protein
VNVWRRIGGVGSRKGGLESGLWHDCRDDGLHSEFGVVAVSSGDELVLGVGGGRLGLGVPLLPSAITCRIV